MENWNKNKNRKTEKKREEERKVEDFVIKDIYYQEDTILFSIQDW